MIEEQQQLKEEEKKALNERLERIGWAFFLIMIGGLALVPGDKVPEGTWLIGAGLIMLGLNAARLHYNLKMSGFSLVLGVIALASGLGDLVGFDLPLIPILLIIFGISLLARPWLENKTE